MGLVYQDGEALNHVIAFSKDRAMQCEAMIRSYDTHANGEGFTGTDTVRTVLFKASTPQHARQYAQLEKTHGHRWNFVKEGMFKQDVMKLVPDSGPLLWIVDDTIFFRPFNLGVMAEHLKYRTSVLGFSLRLGANTDYCYPISRRQVPPTMNEDNAANPVCEFEWYGADGDFGYNFDVSSSMYRAEDVKSAIDSGGFSGPNSLESELCVVANRIATTKPKTLCYKTSVACAVPLNVTQSVVPNRSGSRSDRSVAALAAMFDEGWRVNVDALKGFVTNAAHEEIDLTFRKMA